MFFPKAPRPQSDSSHAAARPPLHVLPRWRVQDVDLPAGALVQAGALELATAAIGPGSSRFQGEIVRS